MQDSLPWVNLFAAPFAPAPIRAKNQCFQAFIRTIIDRNAQPRDMKYFIVLFDVFSCTASMRS